MSELSAKDNARRAKLSLKVTSKLTDQLVKLIPLLVERKQEFETLEKLDDLASHGDDGGNIGLAQAGIGLAMPISLAIQSGVIAGCSEMTYETFGPSGTGKSSQ